jgi:hypothetical protein
VLGGNEDNRLDITHSQQAPAFVHTGWNTEVVRAANVDGGLVRFERGADGGDDAIGDLIRAAGVCLAHTELRALLSATAMRNLLVTPPPVPELS